MTLNLPLENIELDSLQINITILFKLVCAMRTFNFQFVNNCLRTFGILLVVFDKSSFDSISNYILIKLTFF